MKRCPECRRDYYDETLLYCLDNGSALLEGPASGSESATAILHSSVEPTPIEVLSEYSETQLHSTHQGAEPGRKFGVRERLSLVSGLLVLLLIAGFFGYRYLASAPSKQIESIAVMPFVNASGNADNEYLSDGLTESLINSLSRLPDLAVKAPSTVFRYKGKDVTSQQVGSDLSVQAVLNGRIVQRGDQLTLSLDLVNASTGDQIWGQQYNRKVSDLVSLQAEIASEVSQKLRANISPEDRQKLVKGSTSNADAYQLYLKGNYFVGLWTKESMQKGFDYLNQAIAADPDYALAYSGLAYYYLSADEWYLPPKDAMPKVRDAAKKALAIDETHAPAHSLLAVVYHWYDWDWAAAEREFKRAIELDPNHYRSHQYYALFLATQGRGEEAIAEAKRAQQLDPVSTEAGANLGIDLILTRRYDEAIDALQKTIELDDTFFYGHFELGRVYKLKGRLPEAISESQRAIQLQPGNTEVWAWAGNAYAVSGNKTEALKIIDKLKERSKTEYVAPVYIALIYAGLGDSDQVFAWLDRSFEDRGLNLIALNVEPEWDPVRSDPRFIELVKKVGLPH